MIRLAGAAVALCALIAPLHAQPTTTEQAAPAEQAVRGEWSDGQGAEKRAVDFTLRPCGPTWRGEARSPRKGTLHRLVLRQRDGRWELSLEARQRRLGAAQRMHHGPRYRWCERGAVALERSGNVLSDGENWRLELPSEASASAQLLPPATQDPPKAELAPVDTRTTVRVLLTGFDRFPRLINHPQWERGGVLPPIEERQPQINPSGWSVRRFTVQHLSAEFRGEIKVELFKLNDLPVVYVEGAQAVMDAIQRLEPHVVISTGVGSNGAADADVERVCSNVMKDGYSFGGDQDPGPFQIPPSWPPSEPMNEWSDEDRAWLSRYPDNAGVSYNGAEIVPGGPEELESLLPVDRIVSAVQAKGLRAIPGGGGPGRYICNNVMYQVIRTQAARGQLGGFIHMRSWSEQRQDSYLEVLRIAVEESAREVVERQRARAVAAAGPR